MPVGELHSHGAYSVRCTHNLLGDAHIDSGALLEIHVQYTPRFLPWWHKEGGQQFVLKYDKQGNTLWIPTAYLAHNSDELEQVIVNP